MLLELLTLTLALALAGLAYHAGYQDAKRRYLRRNAHARLEVYEAGYRHGKKAAVQPRDVLGRWARKPTISPNFLPIPYLQPKSLKK